MNTKSRIQAASNALIPSADSNIWKFFVKYDRLSEIIYGAYAGSNDDRINIFFDMNSVTRNLIGYDTSGYGYKDYISIVSAMINMCGHYREFFRRMGVYSKFYIINSFNMPQSSIAAYPNYNMDFREKVAARPTIVKGVQTACNLLNIICPYLPDIFFLNSNFESGVVIYDIILRDKMQSANLILSLDLYLYQLIPKAGATLLRPVKESSIDNPGQKVDKSDIFFWNQNGSNFWRGLLELRRATKAYKDSYDLSPVYCNNVLALSNAPSRSIKGRFPITTSIEVIQKAIEANYLISTPITSIPPEIVYQAVQNYILSIKKKYKSFPTLNDYLTKFRVLDIEYQHAFFLESNECKSMQFVNLNDVNGLMEINSKYLSEYPIDIDLL